jgi:DMSO/TMAO reductase YedYZ molybdopterin-dependent catalytic subunit
MGILRRRTSNDDRVPAGQHTVKDFPVLHVGDIPYTEVPTDWDFRVYGRVAVPVRWSHAEFRNLPTTSVTTDIHCVTSWTKLDTAWDGVSTNWLLDLVQPNGATHVVAHAEGGYTANMPIEDLLTEQSLLAYRYDGQELTPEHGFPLRLLVPHKYLWKSAKWLRALEFVSGDEPGYWERFGYSNTADPWKEERYAF